MVLLENTYKGKRVLVTGGAGAVGTNLVRELVNLGAEVVIVDNLSSGHKENIRVGSNIRFVQGDIANSLTLDEAFSEKVDIVFHLAAFFANQNSVEHPVQDAHTNILGTLELLEKSKQQNVSLFIYANTSCMYSHFGLNWSERSKDFYYDTPYSISKHSGEQYVKWYYKYYKFPAVSVRIFNSYGPFEYPGKYRNVIPNFISYALKGKSLTITGSGKETRSFTYVDDTVRGILLAGVHYDNTWQIYNIGSEKETKIIDLAEKINTLTGNTAPIIFTERRLWDKTTRRRPSINRAKKHLGYKPSVSLEEGIERTIDWLKGTDSL